MSLLVTNDFGCTSTHSEWVVIEDKTPVYVPNSFTPGGVTSKPDGLNDAFRAEFRDYGLITDYSLQIFDRWGELIWESSDPGGVLARQCAPRWLRVGALCETRRLHVENPILVHCDERTHRELTGHVTIVR